MKVRDPALPGRIVMLGVAVTGFVILVFAWRAVADSTFVPRQFPDLVAGGIGGVGLIGMGAALFDLQTSRRDAADEQRLTDDILDEVASLVALAPELRRRSRRA
ncbi:MAG: hypothetical protein ACRDJI_09880 [Actinomycetota bacterium]